MSYTKGKWTFEKSKSSNKKWEREFLVRSEKGCKECKNVDNYHICKTLESATGLVEAEANARLISASPDLLEALIEVVKISDRKHDAWDKAKLAIEKAGGVVDVEISDRKHDVWNKSKLTIEKVGGVVDVKYLEVPNICFSLTDKDDKREIDFIKQRIERGFDDSETWSLRDTMVLFILPRLKRYQEIANDFLKRDDELVNDIDCFIKTMELVSIGVHTPEEEKQMVEGLEKFPKIFMSLWW